jgi:hypothetical protein
MDYLQSIVSPEVYWSVLLIIHGLISITLIGALSHQAFSLFKNTSPKKNNIVARYGAVQGSIYTSTVCILWLITFLFGGWIYARYRIAIRIPLEQQGIWLTQGFFELKEHLVTLGFFLLPSYYALWKFDPNNEFLFAKKFLTLTLTFLCWYSFLVGHIVNNVRGFGS